MNRRPRTSYEPRVLVSGEKDGRWAANGTTVDEALSTGVYSWAYAFNGDYLGHRNITRKDLDRYDLVIMNMNTPLLPLVRLAGDRPASVTWVSLVEGSATEYFLPHTDLKALLDTSDLVNVINRHSLPLFRSLTQSKVESIGIPYPVDGVKQFIVPVEARQKRIFLCAHLSRQWNEYLAAREIGLPYYGYELGRPRPDVRSRLTELIKTGSYAWDSEDYIKKTRALYKALYNDHSLGITKYTKDTESYLTEHSGSYFWINLDSRYTWSRFTLDAAALCMPLITTSSTYHGEVFFPETTLPHAMDIERAVEIGTRLKNDRDFYDRVAAYPGDKMDFLRADTMKRTLLGALNLL
jgi:hypothetical protein